MSDPTANPPTAADVTARSRAAPRIGSDRSACLPLGGPARCRAPDPAADCTGSPVPAGSGVCNALSAVRPLRDGPTLVSARTDGSAHIDPP